MKTSVLALLAAGTAACISIPQPAAPPSQGALESQQRAAFAQSMGYPTKKSPEELEATIQKQTKDFKPGAKAQGRLDAPAAITIEGVKGTCYTVVMRLSQGAAWGLGAEAGLKFDFRAPTGPGSGGPGLVGPGAVASVGCAEATGPITLTMAPMVGRDPIGQGTFDYQVWSHVLTAAEARHLEEDKQRQIEEQREFARQEEARKQQRLATGCNKCDARYQGCIGAGRSRGACDEEYRSCAFEEAGADYLSACPSPR